MAKGNLAAEPSMEEILASIRRIIADEEPGQAGAKKTEKGFIPEPMADDADAFEAPGSLEEDILDLAAAEEEGPAESLPAKSVTPVDVDDVSFSGNAPPPPARQTAPPLKNDWSEPVNRSAPQQFQAPPPELASSYPEQIGLISAHTDAAVHAAFNSLASAIFSSEPRTIEDLTKELLRPLLKQWLDDNLPSLVERMVREVLEDVARRGRR